MSYRHLLGPALSCLAVIGLGACSSSTASDDASGSESPGETPVATGKGDSVQAGFSVSGARGWYLVGNELSAGNDRFEVVVKAPSNVRYAHLWLDSRSPLKLQHVGSEFRLSLDISSLPVGEHKVLINANGRSQAFASLTFRRSHPLYVFVSNDWDTSDNQDAMLERQERLHAEHPELRLTHFVGPYTFTDPEVAPERAEYLASWVKGLRDQHADEIGLHIHPYCNFVNTTSVACRTEPSFAKAYGDPTGYTVVLSSYSKDEMRTLLERADELFTAHGLGKPTSFRAGGWTAELHTFEALAEDGFVADASAANWARLEEWKGVWGTTLYAWNQEHWSPVNDTTQPYYPNQNDILASGEPTLPLLELPDNGALVDYVSASEMIDVFRANFPGNALDKPGMVSIGYHPPNFSESFFSRIDGALDEIDHHLASKGEGPVVYATASELPKVWQRP